MFIKGDVKLRKSSKTAGSVQKNILSVSWRLFVKHGYDKTTYQMIADEIGITKATITYYFKSKPWILYYHFTNYANSIREYINANLTEGFNYYLYFCILTIRFFKEIMSSADNLRLFCQPDFTDLLSTEWISYFETDFRNITEDFHKDFSDEEIQIMALMSTGGRNMILKHFSESGDNLSNFSYNANQCCKYLAYLTGTLSRLDEATISKNISRAFEFVDAHDFSGIILGA